MWDIIISYRDQKGIKMIPQTISLTDGNITLKPLQIIDAEELVWAVQESVNEIMPWMGRISLTYDLTAAIAWVASLAPRWKEGTQYAFGIRDNIDDAFLGTVGLNHINTTQRIGNLGYWVRTSKTKQGIATRAAKLAARFSFERLDLVRSEIVVAVGNEPSLRVAEKTGAKREGILRNRLVVRDKIFDAVMHSLISEDL